MRTNLLPRGQGIGRKVAHDPGDPLITSHCPFCGSGQVVGRSDGTIGCGFCGQNYIVRVQPAFPGMPQMPSPGGGAPSDVGPDGGLMDPGMIGPDGMPAGGMPPPGEEGEEGDEGGPPFGDEDDGSGSPPPSSASDSKKNDNGSGGSKSPGNKKSDKKGPPSKKESSLYRGFSGQALTEDQFIRHLAVTLSGANPAVMARLRADSAAGRRS